MSEDTKSSFPYQINGKKYQISIRIFNLKQNYDITLVQTIVRRIQIINDLDSYYPHFILDFKDIAGTYSNKAMQTGQYAIISIVPPDTQGKSTNKETINICFLVDKHEVLSVNTNQITYRISGPMYIAQYFGQHLNFATNKTQPQQSPYLLIKKILNLIKDEIQQQIPPCTRTMHFISDQNKTVKDHIKYCLDIGADEDNPPTYLYHKLIDNKPYLINRNFLIDTKQYYCNHGLILPTRKGNQKIDNELIIYNFKSYSNLTTNRYYQTAALQHRWTYDTINRKWSYKQFLPQRYKQLLSFDKKQSKKIKSVYDIQKFTESNIRLYSQNFEYNVYSRLHNLQLATNCIQFYVQGNVIRDCGQTIQITCRDKNFQSIYGGLWQVFSVSHIIQGNKYVNILNCYRTFSLNNRKQK